MDSEMLSITTPSYTHPSRYQLTTVQRPAVVDPTDVLIQVHAASINPIDVKKANGVMKAVLREKFPYQIGFDCAGVVTAIGSSVKKVKVGDDVYALLSEATRGSWSEYAKCPENFVALKPKNISHEDAASLPLAALTALQAFRRYKGSLAGKTIFVPAGLSGTGSYGCQLAKNVFQAGKVITTVSTAKVDRVAELLGEGVVDEIIDYTENDPMKVIPAGSVDFIFDTTGQAMQFLSLMVPKTGMIISVSTQPSGTGLADCDYMRRPDKPAVPFLIRIFLNVGHTVSQYRAWRWGAEYDYLFVEPSSANLEFLAECVEEGKLVPVVGSTVPLRDVERLRSAAESVYNGKGGIGKTVISVRQN